MKNIKTILLSLSLLASSICFADISVITHPNNTEELSQADIRQIFLGKRKAFANGNAIEVFDLADDSEEKASFAKKVLRKSISSLNSYWSRMLFSSKGQPPKTLNSSEEAIKVVSTNESAIAYIDSKDVNDSIKVLLTINE